VALFPFSLSTQRWTPESYLHEGMDTSWLYSQLATIYMAYECRCILDGITQFIIDYEKEGKLNSFLLGIIV
jgi:hypothetical protein